MSQVMNSFLQLIQKHGTSCIILFGIVIGIGLIWNGAVLSGKKDRIEEALFTKNKKYFKDVIKHEVLEEDDEDSRPTPDKIRSLETDFYNVCSIHDVLVQMIPLFPLLGILGTVAGLMLQASAGGDIDKLVSSLNTALNTTFYGIIFAILLKSIEALFPSRIINSVEVMLDDFNKKLSIAEMFQNNVNNQ